MRLPSQATPVIRSASAALIVAVRGGVDVSSSRLAVGFRRPRRRPVVPFDSIAIEPRRPTPALDPIFECWSECLGLIGPCNELNPVDPTGYCGGVVSDCVLDCASSGELWLTV